MYFFFFKQKTAYDMRISDWSSDVCSSDLLVAVRAEGNRARPGIQSTLGPVEIGVADVGIESPTFLLGLSNVVHRTCLPVAALAFAGILRVSCSGTIHAPVSRCWAGLNYKCDGVRRCRLACHR